MKTIYLVSCVAQKDLDPRPLPAHMRYTSPWFKAAKRYVERQLAKEGFSNGDNWYILSAKYGLIHPSEEILDYNQFLDGMDKPDVEEWRDRVRSDLVGTFGPGDRVVLLAGRSYRKHIEEWLKKQGAVVEVPMRSLGIGEQVAWLNKN